MIDPDDFPALTEITPEPWRAVENSAANERHTYWEIIAGKGFFDEDGHGFSATGYMSPANARLLAAAPDLLAALKEVLDLFDGQEDIKDGPEGAQLPNDAMRACMIARAAIALATNKS